MRMRVKVGRVFRKARPARAVGAIFFPAQNLKSPRARSQTIRPDPAHLLVDQDCRHRQSIHTKLNMSSPAEPKRRRLDDDSTSLAGVSFVAQDVSENASSKTPATEGDADEGADLHAQLKVAVERRKEAQDALQRAKHEEESARIRLRIKGEVEFDSLIFVGNDGLSAALAYLTMSELARSELVCRTFRKLSLSSSRLWTSIEKKQRLSNKSASEDARTRVIRYHVASKFARQLEPHISEHQHTGDVCEGCSDFPSELLTSPSPGDYELFVRFSRMNGGNPTLLFEGFVDYHLYRYREPFSRHYPSKLSFNMDDFNLSRWPELDEMFQIEWERNDFDFVDHAMKVLLDVTATVVVVEKTTSEAHLVVGSDDFSYEKEDDHGNRTIYSRSDMCSEIHEGPDRLVYETQDCCLAFKWNKNNSDSRRKFECHVIAY